MKEHKHKAILTVTLLLAGLLAGCGGTKVLKEAQPMQTTQPLAAAADPQLEAVLDWVIVRDGPGTWAKNADWDEYLLRVRNHSGEAVSITGLVVVDSLGTPLTPASSRKQLVRSSKESVRRYKDSDLKLKAGRGVATMMVAGAAVTAVGVGTASAVAAGSVLSGAGAVGGAGAAAASGLLLLGPALAVGGIVRGVNNSKVNTAIERRQTEFPLVIPPGESRPLDVFFPLAPSPQVVQLLYSDAGGEHRMIIDTRAALDGLHLAAPEPE